MNQARVSQNHSVFAMVCRVEVDIQASAQRIWELLTDAKGFPGWNSTVTGIDGEIREGETIRIHVPGSERAFNPKVSGVTANQRMTWIGGFAPMFQGVRTFELRAGAGGSTNFAMEERFSGLMLPLIKKSLPDFAPIFERYASDLKQAAERS